MRIAIALFDGVEELDWAGPWEVMAAWARHFVDDGVEVLTCAPVDRTVECAKGARVLPDTTWEHCPPVDLLVFPGGQGTRAMLGDAAIRTWVQKMAATTPLMASVCTGALVFADAGLLDGRRATTHWNSLDHLASLGSEIDVRRDERYVDDGDIVTAAGVSAGIDMALHLIGRLHSPERARQVQKLIEYYPEPPA